MVGRRGEHVVAAFLCSQNWHPAITDAEGYDILATKGEDILRVQVKACPKPSKTSPSRNVVYYQWTCGIGRHKEILIPKDHYDVLALVALGPNFIRFINAEDVNKKSYRIKPEDLNAGLAGDTWREITNAL